MSTQLIKIIKKGADKAYLQPSPASNLEYPFTKTQTSGLYNNQKLPINSEKLSALIYLHDVYKARVHLLTIFP